MRYLMWRVATGLHNSACISFMVAGHTKFAPDWCFGLLKRKMRRTLLSSQAYIEAANKDSSIEAACKDSSVCNRVQCVGTQDGQVVVPFHDWATFFCYPYKPSVGLLSFQSFAVSSEAPSVMVVRKFLRGAAESPPWQGSVPGWPAICRTYQGIVSGATSLSLQGDQGVLSGRR